MTLTREEILAMQPGEELDALIGKEIMKAVPDIQWWVTDGDESGIFITFDYESEAKEWLGERKERFPNWAEKEGAHIVRKEMFKRYSESISAAWELVSSIKGFQLQQKSSGNYTVRNSNNRWRWSEGVESKSASEAICKAALLAVLNL